MRSNRRAPKRGVKKTHLFKRVVYQEKNIQVTTAGAVTDEYFYRLTQVPQNAEFTSLYEQYSIKLVKVELIPRPTSSEMGQSGAPQVHSVIDFNDSNPLTGLQDYLQYETYKSTRGLQIHKRVFKPMVAATVYNGAIASGYSNPNRSIWVDTTSPAVQHYGLKIYISPIDSGSEISMFYDVKTTYYLAMRGVK